MSEGLEPKVPEAIAVPSGQAVLFHEMVSDAAGYGLTMRFRFIAPDLRAALAALDYADLEADLAALCLDYALPRIANTGPQPAMIVISLSERELPFGEIDPEVAQVFEAYRPEDGTCVWEEF